MVSGLFGSAEIQAGNVFGILDIKNHNAPDNITNHDTTAFFNLSLSLYPAALSGGISRFCPSQDRSIFDRFGSRDRAGSFPQVSKPPADTLLQPPAHFVECAARCGGVVRVAQTA